MSLRELKAAIRHAAEEDWPAFVLVSHSFEMMNRDKGVANRMVQRRFEALCEWIASEPGVTTGTFADAWVLERLKSPQGTTCQPQALPRAPMREMLRMAEQAFANAVYG